MKSTVNIKFILFILFLVVVNVDEDDEDDDDGDDDGDNVRSKKEDVSQINVYFTSVYLYPDYMFLSQTNTII